MIPSKNSIRPWLMITVGCLVMTAAFNLFLIPFKLAPGGVSGLATVVHYLSGNRVPVGMLMLAMNIPLFLLSYRNKGRTFFVRSIYGAFMLSAMIDFTAPFTEPLVNELVVRFDSSMAIPDLMLNGLIGGMIMGVGLGIVLKEDATTGGTDLAAAILKKIFPGLSIGQLLLVLDAAVILAAALAFRSLKLGLYAAVSMYVCTKSMDAYLEGVNFAKSLMIISDRAEQIAARLMNDLERGVTGLHGIGMYSGSEKTILLCVVKRDEIQDVKEIVSEIDPRAFVLLSDVREVMGEGFIPILPAAAEKSRK